ncbi:MAG: serine/threonine protein kinase [Planctomycetes bacterium]|nr:serine/threonine protein kinase [Planctomycetota bacterium]
MNETCAPALTSSPLLGTARVATPPPTLRSSEHDRPTTRQPSDSEIPVLVGGVRILRMIGRGGMGAVYLGHHEALDLDVAVKLLKHDAGDERLLEEARAAARVQHANVVRVLHAGRDAGRVYVVMELINGGDCADLLKEMGRLPWREALALAIQAADGLAAIHAAGIVHRDIKPANLLLGTDNTLKITDLGLALHPGNTREPRAGHVSGTPAYMAPEQGRDSRAAKPQADVYALGVTVYHMLTGSKPFWADTPSAMLRAHQSKPIPDVRSVIGDVPPRLCSLIARMMAKDPAQRPTDGAAVAAELRTALAMIDAGDSAEAATKPTAAPRPSVSRHRFGPVRATVVGLVLATISIAGSYGLLAAVPGPAAGNGVAAVAAGNNPVDAWRSAPRAAFLVGQDLSPSSESALDGALRATGLRVIERQQLTRLVAEQDLVRNQATDAATAIAAGRLIGGHIICFARASGESIQLSIVHVETGERVASEIVAAGEAAARVGKLVSEAARDLPARGYLTREADGTTVLDVGRNHGVRVGDRFRILDGDAQAPGKPTAVAEVVACTPGKATVEIKGELPKLPALAERVSP